MLLVDILYVVSCYWTNSFPAAIVYMMLHTCCYISLIYMYSQKTTETAKKTAKLYHTLFIIIIIIIIMIIIITQFGYFHSIYDFLFFSSFYSRVIMNTFLLAFMFYACAINLEQMDFWYNSTCFELNFKILLLIWLDHWQSYKVSVNINDRSGFCFNRNSRRNWAGKTIYFV